MINNKPKKIAVLMGGPSNEREISIKSGKAVYSALKNTGFDVICIDAIDNWQRYLVEEKIEVAFIALHGKFGEDGVVQTILESMRIPYTGSGVRASRLALNKIDSKRIFLKAGIPTPEYKVLTKKNSSSFNEIHECPMVIKPALEGSSIGLSIVRKKKDFKKALELAFSYDERIILEKYIPGAEITVGILNEKPLPVIKVVPKRSFYDYKAKYTRGITEYLVPAPISKKAYKLAQRYALLAHKVLGCKDFSRVDMIYGKDGQIRVLELNSIPGLTKLSLLPKAAKAEGIEFNQLCVKLVELSLKKNAKKTLKKKEI